MQNAEKTVDVQARLQRQLAIYICYFWISLEINFNELMSLTAIWETKWKSVICEIEICKRSHKHAWDSRKSKGLGHFHFLSKHDILVNDQVAPFFYNL